MRRNILKCSNVNLNHPPIYAVCATSIYPFSYIQSSKKTLINLLYSIALKSLAVFQQENTLVLEKKPG